MHNATWSKKFSDFMTSSATCLMSQLWSWN